MAGGKVYNLAEEPAFSELERAQDIAKQFGWDGEFIILPRQGTLREEATSRKIRDELGLNEPVPLPEAIRRRIA
jgi:nucleoside-diphosphate-sugar epimerase